ncbi:MAG: MBL fold metallo-hydrolase [Parvularculaceae bacterium]
MAEWRFPRRYVDGADAIDGDFKIKSEPFDASVFIYAVVHPALGLHLIDAGFPDYPERQYEFHQTRSLYGQSANVLYLTSAKPWVDASGLAPARGVFVTHLHFDHVRGVSDSPTGVPIDAGPGDGAAKHISS